MVVDPAFETTDEPVKEYSPSRLSYLERILTTDSKYGCPLGRTALRSIRKPSSPNLIRENFQGWIGAVRECVTHSMPESREDDSEALYICSALPEGGATLAPHASVESFDRAIKQLREHFRLRPRAEARSAQRQTSIKPLP